MWEQSLRERPVTFPMLRPSTAAAPAAADACAAGEKIGIGGWCSILPDAPDDALFWFSEQFTVADFPVEWDMHRDAQRNIACYETLAQTALTELRASLHRNQNSQVVYRQDCDNAPSVGAMNKLFTTALPLKFFTQNLTGTLARLGVQIEVVHLPGSDNDLADGLSREKPEVVRRMDANKRMRFSVPSLLRSHTRQRVFPVDAPMNADNFLLQRVVHRR